MVARQDQCGMRPLSALRRADARGHRDALAHRAPCTPHDDRQGNIMARVALTVAPATRTAYVDCALHPDRVGSACGRTVAASRAVGAAAGDLIFTLGATAV